MMMKASSETVIARPADRIDLVEWLTNLSDRDYQACSPGHRAAGVFRENGRLGSINVESVGGHLLVQHYLDENSRSDHVVMRSRNTRVYVMHLVPATTAKERPSGEIDSSSMFVEIFTSSLNSR